MQLNNEWVLHACEDPSFGLGVLDLLLLDELLLLKRLQGKCLAFIVASFLSDEDNLTIGAFSKYRYHLKIVFLCALNWLHLFDT